MTLEQFKQACTLSGLSEVERTCYLAFFYLRTKNVQEFTASEASKWLVNAGGAAPNQSRLDRSLRASRLTIKGQHGWRLRGNFIQELTNKFPLLSEKSQEVVDSGTILPEVDYRQSRGYIESLAKQINASYEYNLYDACAVLMRRLVEILLVLAYRHLKIEAAIQDNGVVSICWKALSMMPRQTHLSVSHEMPRAVLTSFDSLGISQLTKLSTPAAANTLRLISMNTELCLLNFSTRPPFVSS